MNRFLLIAGLTFFCLLAPAAAQDVPSPNGNQSQSSGEVGNVLACFYECKEHSRSRWEEITSLMLINANKSMGTGATIVFRDGNQQPIATSTVVLAQEDLAEINVCQTLHRSKSLLATAGVPKAGFIQVLSPASIGVYGWVKNLLGTFSKKEDEPFEGRVNGIAKTECKLIPPGVTNPTDIFARLELFVPPVPEIAPILIEDTESPMAEEAVFACSRGFVDCSGCDDPTPTCDVSGGGPGGVVTIRGKCTDGDTAGCDTNIQ